jgi:serine/threonine protein phosphatase PrpC
MNADTTPVQIEVYGTSDVGLVRQRNEDNWAELPEHKVYVLADGMGGHNAGDIASAEAVFTFCELARTALSSLQGERKVEESVRLFSSIIEEVNKKIFLMGEEDLALKGMGTTLCFLSYQEKNLIYGHVGDSRIYRLRGESLEQLTDDHSLVQELIQFAKLSKKQAEDCASKSIITKAVGTSSHVIPSVGYCAHEQGDVYLMCSDGLTDFVSDQETRAILLQQPTLEAAAHKLVQTAKEHGGLDNITVVLVRV